MCSVPYGVINVILFMYSVFDLIPRTSSWNHLLSRSARRPQHDRVEVNSGNCCISYLLLNLAEGKTIRPKLTWILFQCNLRKWWLDSWNHLMCIPINPILSWSPTRCVFCPFQVNLQNSFRWLAVARCSCSLISEFIYKLWTKETDAESSYSSKLDALVCNSGLAEFLPPDQSKQEWTSTKEFRAMDRFHIRFLHNKLKKRQIWCGTVFVHRHIYCLYPSNADTKHTKKLTKRQIWRALTWRRGWICILVQQRRHGCGAFPENCPCDRKFLDLDQRARFRTIAYFYALDFFARSVY